MEYDDKIKSWDDGWDAFWNNEPQSSCPSDIRHELRDEWMLGWFTAQRSQETDSDICPPNP